MPPTCNSDRENKKPAAAKSTATSKKSSVAGATKKSNGTAAKKKPSVAGATKKSNGTAAKKKPSDAAAKKKPSDAATKPQEQRISMKRSTEDETAVDSTFDSVSRNEKSKTNKKRSPTSYTSQQGSGRARKRTKATTSQSTNKKAKHGVQKQPSPPSRRMNQNDVLRCLLEDSDTDSEDPNSAFVAKFEAAVKVAVLQHTTNHQDRPKRSRKPPMNDNEESQWYTAVARSMSSNFVTTTSTRRS
jgi:hypothetical protein